MGKPRFPQNFNGKMELEPTIISFLSVVIVTTVILDVFNLLQCVADPPGLI